MTEAEQLLEEVRTALPVLQTMCRTAGLTLGWVRAAEMLERIDQALDQAPVWRIIGCECCGGDGCGACGGAGEYEIYTEDVTLEDLGQ